MTKIITAITLFVCSFLTAQAQYEQGMGKAMGLWKEGKASDASALFERIASAEKDNWLPNYYVALVNTTEAFNPANKEKVSALLAKAQSALDIELTKNPNNAELIVMQAMIHTAWIAYDPMTNGMKLSGTVVGLYMKASAIAPENPRVVFCKAEFDLGGAKWTGADVKVICKEVERSIDLFAKFKPENQFSPNWGLDRAQETLKNCGK
jgi:hypothetical protein